MIYVYFCGSDFFFKNGHKPLVTGCFFNSRFHKHLCYVEELPKPNKMLGIYNCVTKKKSSFHVPDFNISLKTMSSPWHWISSIESFDFRSAFVFDTLIDFYGNGVLINTTFSPNATGFHAVRVADLEICEILNNRGLIIIAPRRGVRKSQTTRTDWDLDGGAFQFPLSLSLLLWQTITFQPKQHVIDSRWHFRLSCVEKNIGSRALLFHRQEWHAKKKFFFFYCFSPICWIHREWFFSSAVVTVEGAERWHWLIGNCCLLLKRT